MRNLQELWVQTQKRIQNSDVSTSGQSLARRARASDASAMPRPFLGSPQGFLHPSVPGGSPEVCGGKGFPLVCET